MPGDPSVPPNAGGWVGEPPGFHAPAGINLAVLVDYSTEIVFVDGMKSSRKWLPQLAGLGSPWNTGAPLAVDANGWPLLAPGQAAATLMFNATGGLYPGGTYVCRWDGVGQLEFSFDAKVALTTPGRAEVVVTPSNAGILLRIVQSNASNPVRNVRFVMPGFEATHLVEPFYPLFLERLAHYQSLRFMDWQRTNNSASAHWAQRNKPNTPTQADERGMAVEHMVQLANRLGKHPWMCMPHLATDDYVRQFATLVRDTLHPDLKVHVEYSNEVWNGQFQQATYAQSQGLAAGLSSNPFQAQLRWYSKRAVEMFDIWIDVFGGPGSPGAERVVRVLAGQSGNPWTGETILDHNQANTKADAYAIAPYFGGGLGAPEKAATTVNWTVAQVLADCTNQILGPLAQQMAQNAQAAQNRGVELIAYEGGQHLAGVLGWENNTQLTNLFIAANRDPMMYVVYRLFLDTWRAVGGKTMVAYSSCGEFSKWGSWGSLEYIQQPISSAHKYRALIDFVAAEQPVLHYGSTCGPLIGAVGTPVAGGAAMHLIAGNAPPFAPGLLFAAGAFSNWGHLNLPVDLAAMGAPGCALHIPFDVVMPAGAGSQGTFVLPFAPPQYPGIVGTELHFQFAFAAPGANAAGAVFSSALRLVVQG